MSDDIPVEPIDIADQGRQAIWKVVHELWQLLDDGESDPNGFVTIDQARYRDVSAAMDELEALVPESAGPFWGGYPVDHFWKLRPSGLASDNGYVGAFFDIATMLDIGARAWSPSETWRREMRPKLITALAEGLAARRMAHRFRFASDILEGMTDGIDGDRLGALVRWTRRGEVAADERDALERIFAAPWRAAEDEAGWVGDPRAEAVKDIARVTAEAAALS